MDARRVTLWCKVLGKLVEAVIVRHPNARPVPGVPEGWLVKECLDRDTECFGKGCPFTTDGGDSPFGEVGERLDLPLESLDPFADPSFEGEWG